MANIFKILLRHVKEYCQAAAIHGPRHIVSPQLAVVERLVYDLFSRDIIKAKVGFLFRARVSFVEEALGTNLLKSRLFYLGGQFILAHWKIEKKNNKKV